MVHQHFMLVPTFTVLENVMLGAEGGFRLRGGEAGIRAKLERLARAHGLEVDPDALIDDLPVGIRQRVEILKALFRGARILILDEPTGVLTPDETDRLFAVLRAVRAAGGTVLLITHKLREVMAVCDTVSVLRRGRLAGQRRTGETTAGRACRTHGRAQGRPGGGAAVRRRGAGPGAAGGGARLEGAGRRAPPA